MAHYLVVAHQTATSTPLLERARELATLDHDAAFTLLIPETHVQHRLVCDEQETREAAQQRAVEARAAFEAAGLPVLRTEIGSASPAHAVHDELRRYPWEHDAIVLSTFAPAHSRWLMGDLPSRLAREQELPVFHVYEGGDATWDASEAQRRMVAEGARRAPRARTAAAIAPAAPESARDWLPFAALLVVHAVLGIGLAVRFDSMFFLGEAFVVTFLALLALSLWRLERPEPGGTPSGGTAVRP